MSNGQSYHFPYGAEAHGGDNERNNVFKGKPSSKEKSKASRKRIQKVLPHQIALPSPTKKSSVAIVSYKGQY